VTHAAAKRSEGDDADVVELRSMLNTLHSM